MKIISRKLEFQQGKKLEKSKLENIQTAKEALKANNNKPNSITELADRLELIEQAMGL